MRGVLADASRELSQTSKDTRAHVKHHTTHTPPPDPMVYGEDGNGDARAEALDAIKSYGYGDALESPTRDAHVPLRGVVATTCESLESFGNAAAARSRDSQSAIDEFKLAVSVKSAITSAAGNKETAELQTSIIDTALQSATAAIAAADNTAALESLVRAITGLQSIIEPLAAVKAKEVVKGHADRIDALFKALPELMQTIALSTCDHQDWQRNVASSIRDMASADNAVAVRADRLAELVIGVMPALHALVSDSARFSERVHGTSALLMRAPLQHLSAVASGVSLAFEELADKGVFRGDLHLHGLVPSASPPSQPAEPAATSHLSARLRSIEHFLSEGGDLIGWQSEMEARINAAAAVRSAGTRNTSTSGGGDDGTFDTGPFGSHLSMKDFAHDLSSTDIDKYKRLTGSALEIGLATSWLRTILSKFSLKHPVIDLLCQGMAAWFEMLRVASPGPHERMLVVDRWLLRAIHSCFDDDAPRVKLVCGRIDDARPNATDPHERLAHMARSSGVAIVELLLGFDVPVVRNEKQSIEQRYSSTDYFATVDSPDSVMVAVRELLRDWRLSAKGRAEEASDPNAVFHAVLRKAPSNLQGTAEREITDMLNAVRDAEIEGRVAYDHSRFITVFAHALAGANSRTGARAREAFATSADDADEYEYDDENGDEYCVDATSLADAAALEESVREHALDEYMCCAADATPKCWTCGLDVGPNGVHPIGKCKQTCPTCLLPCCNGARLDVPKPLCELASPVLDEQAINQLSGKPRPWHQHQKRKAAHQRLHASSLPRSAHRPLHRGPARHDASSRGRDMGGRGGRGRFDRGRSGGKGGGKGGSKGSSSFRPRGFNVSFADSDDSHASASAPLHYETMEVQILGAKLCDAPLCESRSHAYAQVGSTLVLPSTVPARPPEPIGVVAASKPLGTMLAAAEPVGEPSAAEAKPIGELSAAAPKPVGEVLASSSQSQIQDQSQAPPQSQIQLMSASSVYATSAHSPTGSAEPSAGGGLTTTCIVCGGAVCVASRLPHCHHPTLGPCACDAPAIMRIPSMPPPATLDVLAAGFDGSARTSTLKVVVLFLIDRGSQVDLINIANAARYASHTAPVDVRISSQGKGQHTIVDRVHQVDGVLPGGHTLRLQLLDSPDSRKPILNEQNLWRTHGCFVDTPSARLIVPDGSRVQLVLKPDDERLWLPIELTAQPEVMAVVEETVVTAAADSFAAIAHPLDRTTTLAARYNLSADGVKSASAAIDGMDLPKTLTQRLKTHIDADEFRRASIMKRGAAPVRSPSRNMLPGHTIIGDEWGKFDTPCALTKSTSQFGSVDTGSSFGVLEGLRTTSLECIFAAIASRVQEERRVGNEPREVRLDRLSAHATPVMKRRLATELNVALTLGAAKYHEAVGAEEVNGDIVTRIADAMFARACRVDPLCNRSFYLLCREYAQTILNDRPCTTISTSVSRREHSGRARPNATKQPLYCFFTKVLVYREKPDRGKHGDVDAGRAYEGRLVNKLPYSYCVYNPSTRQFTYPPRVTPLNEHVLIAAGLPAGSASVDFSMQVQLSDLPHLTLTPTVSASGPRAPPPPQLRRDAYAQHTRLDVLYHMDGKRVWCALTITAVMPTATGRYEYNVVWDDGAWNRDPAYAKFRRLDLQAADAPPSRVRWTLERDAKLPLPVADTSLPFDGRGAAALFLYGGLGPEHPDGIDALAHRALLRAPHLEVVVLDRRNGKAYCVTSRSLRLATVADVREQRYAAVVNCQPCTPYSPRRGVQLGDHDGWFDPPPPGHELFMEEQGVTRDFGLDITLAAHQTPGVQWIVETIADRQGTPGPWGAPELSPAYWAPFKDWRSLFDEDEMQEAASHVDAHRVLCAACWWGSSDLDPQKFFELLFSPESKPQAQLHFPTGMRLCEHASHAVVIEDVDEHGRSRAEASGVYKPELAEDLAACVIHMLSPMHPQASPAPFGIPLPSSSQPAAARVLPPHRSMPTSTAAPRRSPRLASSAVSLLAGSVDAYVLAANDPVEALAACAYWADGTRVSTASFDAAYAAVIALSSSCTPDPSRAIVVTAPPPPCTLDLCSVVVGDEPTSPPAFAIRSLCCRAYLSSCRTCGGMVCSKCGQGSDQHYAFEPCDCVTPAACMTTRLPSALQTCVPIASTSETSTVACDAFAALDDSRASDTSETSTIVHDAFAALGDVIPYAAGEAAIAESLGTHAADMLAALRLARTRSFSVPLARDLAAAALDGDHVTHLSVEQHGPAYVTSHGSVVAIPRTYEVAKATQTIVQVKTPMGMVDYTVPASTAQVYRHPLMEKWLEADRKAHMDLLVGGNRLIRQDEVPHEAVISDVVTARKMKTQADQTLDPHNPFKSRHAKDDRRMVARAKKLGIKPVKTAHVAIMDDITGNIMLADAAARGRDLGKADVGSAYLKGQRINRGKGYMRMCPTVQEYDEDGTPMVYEFSTTMWGEEPAGHEWDVVLDAEFTALGLQRAEGVPALYFIVTADGDLRVAKIVDDLLFSESASTHFRLMERVVDALRARFDGEVKFERAPTSFAGALLTYGPDRDWIKISMPAKITEAVKELRPDFLTATSRPADILTGKALQDAADGLRLPTEQRLPMPKYAKRIQQLIGKVKFPEKRCLPRLTLLMHRLSCVMKYPPPEATAVADAMLWMAWENKDEGFTYRRRPLGAPAATTVHATKVFDLDAPAPSAMTISADASTGYHNVYAIVATSAGAAVHHCTKKINTVCDSIMRAEQVATQKASELAEYIKTIERALGVPRDEPIDLATDNLGNAQVTHNVGSSTRSRHFLVRYEAVMHREAQGIVAVQHVPDEHMPADFLTKWVPAAKLRRCLSYVTGTMLPSRKPKRDV